MEAISHQKFLRTSPKRIKELSRLVKNMSVDKALNRLEFTPGHASKLLIKAIYSARSNAVNNLKLNSANLIVKEIIIGKGPFFKRWQPVSKGMAHSIKKRTAHLTVKVEEKVPPKKEEAK